MTRRSFIAVALSLVLVLSAQSMALARTAPGPAGVMVLCTGTGPMTVLVDETGTPIAPGHVCPDCAMGLFAATLPAVAGLPELLSHTRKPWILTPASGQAGAAVRLPPARAPPRAA